MHFRVRPDGVRSNSVLVFSVYSLGATSHMLVRSGKTYTMQGREDCPEFSQIKHSSDMGIVGRSIAHIYASIADLRSTTGWEFGVTLEMIEIYNDTLRDLLAPVGVSFCSLVVAQNILHLIDYDVDSQRKRWIFAWMRMESPL